MTPSGDPTEMETSIDGEDAIMEDAAIAASELLKFVDMVEELAAACIDDIVDSDIWLPPVAAQDGN